MHIDYRGTSLLVRIGVDSSTNGYFLHSFERSRLEGLSLHENMSMNCHPVVKLQVCVLCTLSCVRYFKTDFLFIEGRKSA